MTFPTLEEKRGPGMFIVSEANGHRSREEIVVADSAVVEPGTILGKITASGKFVQADNVTPAADGSETAAGILYKRTDADGQDAEAVAIVRDAEVFRDELVYPDGADQAQKDEIDADLLALGIVVRDA